MGRNADAFSRVLIVQFSRAFKARHGYAPGISEIAEAVGEDRQRVRNLCRRMAPGVVTYSKDRRTAGAVTR